MTLIQIKQAIADGKQVRWVNDNCHVIRDKIGQYLIVCQSNKSTIGLTWQDDVTMNGKESDFYVMYESAAAREAK